MYYDVLQRLACLLPGIIYKPVSHVLDAGVLTVKIKTRRVYETPDKGDGVRILVDRIWPRGVSKDRADVSFWAKQVAPSNELRKWYGHEPDKWPEFKRRYREELEANPDGVDELLSELGAEVNTFVYSSREEVYNNAAALKDFIESRSLK